jgi:hypothetical protein
MPYVETDAISNGRNMHQYLEDHINDGVPLPKEYDWLYELVPTRSDTNTLTAEVSLGILHDGSPCEFDDPACWFRGKLDVLVLEEDLALIADWKTSKKPYEDPDELNLHATLAKAHYPEVKHWRGFYVWLTPRKMGTLHTLQPAVTLDRLRKRVDRVLQLVAHNQDMPRKHILCPWCDLARCEHYTGRKSL